MPGLVALQHRGNRLWHLRRNPKKTYRASSRLTKSKRISSTKRIVSRSKQWNEITRDAARMKKTGPFQWIPPIRPASRKTPLAGRAERHEITYERFHSRHST